MKFCKYCGGELADHAKFCKHCGRDLTDAKSVDREAESNWQEKSTDKEEQVHNSSDRKPDKQSSDQQEELVTENQEEPVKPEQSEQQMDAKEEYGGADGTGDTPENPDEKKKQNQPKQGGIGASKNSPPSQPTKRMSKKSKIFIGLGALVIILLIVVYQVGSSMTSKDKVLEDFEDAVAKKDVATVSKLLKADGKEIEIDKDSVKGFVDYYAEHPSDFDQAMKHLKQQKKTYDNNPDRAKAQAEEDSDMFSLNLVEDGKKFGIYKDYSIQVTPVYFEVSTNFENTDILMNDEVVATSDSEDFSKEVGPFLPGTYTFTAEYTDDYVELTAEEEASSFDPGVPGRADLHINADELSFYSSAIDTLDKATLYINGEDTGVNMAEEDSFGPVLTDGSMTAALEAEFPWGKTKTEEVPIEDTLMDVEFKLDKDAQEEVKDTIIKFNRELLAAMTTAKKKKFTTATDDVVDEVIETAKSDKKSDYYYKGKFIGVDFYTESFDIDYQDDTWYVKVDTITTFKADSWFGEDTEPELEKSADETGYEVTYDEGDESWNVNYIGWAGDMEDDKMEEHKEKDPKTYTSEWLK